MSLFAFSRSPKNRWLHIAPSGIDGMGAFARKRIPSDTEIGRYTGERIAKDVSRRRLQEGNRFIFYWNEQFDLDGDRADNLCKYLNHSCDANCESRWCDGHIGIFTLRAVAPGEELTINYGYDLDNYRLFPCRCRAKNCVGYMVAEEFFDRLRQTNANLPSDSETGESPARD